MYVGYYRMSFHIFLLFILLIFIKRQFSEITDFVLRLIYCL